MAGSSASMLQQHLPCRGSFDGKQILLGAAVAAAAAFPVLARTEGSVHECNSGDACTDVTRTVCWYEGERLSDEAFVKLALSRKAAVKAPIHSMFRVLCILRIRDDKGRNGYVVGTNSEQGFIGGSICAERAAAVQLRLIGEGVTVDRIFLVSDLPQGDLTPGVLCREFLISQPQIIRGCEVLMICTKDASTRTVTLPQLYPHSCLFSKVAKADLLDWGTKFKAAAQVPAMMTASQQEVYAQAVATTVHDTKDEIHPVRLAAGVLFSDGSVSYTAQQKALEYGNTLDPVSLLAPVLLQKRAQGIHPEMIVQVDQHGILHAPFAPARSFLYENDFDSCVIYVHGDAGDVAAVHVAELVPDAPRHIF